MPLNGMNIEKINYIYSINHKIIQNSPEPPTTRQNHKKSIKCTGTRHTRLERCLLLIFYDIKYLTGKNIVGNKFCRR